MMRKPSKTPSHKMNGVQFSIYSCIRLYRHLGLVVAATVWIVKMREGSGRQGKASNREWTILVSWWNCSWSGGGFILLCYERPRFHAFGESTRQMSIPCLVLSCYSLPSNIPTLVEGSTRTTPRSLPLDGQ